MQFLYHKNAKEEIILLEKEAFLHLKVRRVKLNESIKLRNLKDQFVYEYKLTQLNKNSCLLSLQKQEKDEIKETKFNLAIAMIEPKILEKMLPSLNELGVHKLILVYTDFSQKNFKPDLKRFERILIQSCEQCGRNSLMEIELFETVKKFLENYKKIILVDFEGEDLKQMQITQDILFFIGPEGGFSQKERKMFDKKVKLQCPFILKSQTAALALSAKMLL